jgi:acyl-CoA synthetase (AMP-forming)/AMP-acid ligase II
LFPGTTGLPKAAVISHYRMVLAAMGMYNLFRLREDDVVYTVLPLYHSAGGMIGAGLCTIMGLTMVLRDKYGRRFLVFPPAVAAYRTLISRSGLATLVSGTIARRTRRR